MPDRASESPSVAREFTAGAREVIPVVLGVIPFGLIVGLTASETGLSTGLGIAMSAIIFAGASQLATMQLIAAESAAMVIIMTALVINLRMVMYSAALQPHFSRKPRWLRLSLAYLLTDQAFALSVTSFGERPERTNNHWYYLGVASPLWVVWMIATVIGVVVGAQVPESWGLGFAPALVFLALIFPAITDSSTAAAAVSAGAVALAADPLPYNLGLPLAALAGITAGMIVEHRAKESS